MKNRGRFRIGLKRSCMDRLESGLYGVCIESSVITLTTISVLAITGELLIGLKIIQEPVSSNDRAQNNNDKNFSASPSPFTTGNTIDPGGDNLSPNLVIANNVFRYLSLVIAALFLIEITLKIVAKAKMFCVSPWQVIDCFIVLVSIGLEITFMLITLPSPHWEAFTYVVILRYWRIPYVCNIKADARQVEFEQELEAWRAAKQKTDERCHTLQHKLDQYKLENMVSAKTNGHIVNIKKARKHIKDETDTIEPVLNGIEVDRGDKKPNGIIKASQQNGHSVKMENDEESMIQTKQDKDNTDGAELEKDNVKPVKSVNFNMSCVSIDTTSPSPSPTRHLRVSEKPVYSRTDSESSLSNQAVEEQVVVQIENVLQSPPVSPTDDSLGLLPAMDNSKENYAFENATFEDDDDLNFGKDLQIMADIDGTKTYRSVDGIPMTSL